MGIEFGGYGLESGVRRAARATGPARLLVACLAAAALAGCSSLDQFSDRAPPPAAPVAAAPVAAPAPVTAATLPPAPTQHDGYPSAVRPMSMADPTVRDADDTARLKSELEKLGSAGQTAGAGAQRGFAEDLAARARARTDQVRREIESGQVR